MRARNQPTRTSRAYKRQDYSVQVSLLLYRLRHLVCFSLSLLHSHSFFITHRFSCLVFSRTLFFFLIFLYSLVFTGSIYGLCKYQRIHPFEFHVRVAQAGWILFNISRITSVPVALNPRNSENVVAISISDAGSSRNSKIGSSGSW